MTKRLTALDAFRGMTIALMILVNTPGTWAHVFPPLRHAPWDGWTPTDLVFPFFLFIVGVSMYFSFKRYDHQLTAESSEKILKRTAAIFLVGLLLNAFPKGIAAHSLAWQGVFGVFLLIWLTMPWWKDKVPTGIVRNLEWLSLAILIGLFLFTLGDNRLRVLGVLQRIALAFGIGAFVCLLFKGKNLIYALVIILIGYWLTMIGFGDLTLEGNFQRTVDLVILGDAHMYHGYIDKTGNNIAFDPEGLLSTLPSVGNVIIGFLTGKLISEHKDKKTAVFQLFLYGFPLLLLAYLWNPFFPINKPIWSSSYVLHTCGLGMILLGFSLYLLDVKGHTKWAKPFVVFGLNPLFIYAMSSVTVKILLYWVKGVDASGAVVNGYQALYQNVFANIAGNNEWGSLLFALFYVFVHWVVAYFMYRKRIFVKV
ncbi:MAG: heparan-alpha-glucosaminide N-acetyltransferase domain-containing protein [Bacteroidota bacterium]